MNRSPPAAAAPGPSDLPMNIGQAARASGVSAKMIRHYEQVGLFPATSRTDAGYRQYTGRELATLRFIRHSRDLGFSIDQIRELLGLWQDRDRPSRQVKALAQARIDELDAKLRELQAMKATLQQLIACCHGDDRPDCPIIETLEAEAPVLAEPGRPASPRSRSTRAGLRSGPPQRRTDRA